MTQVMNQFSQAPLKGLMDLRFNPSIMSCQVDESESGELVPGQAVTMVDSADGVPKVIAAADDEADIFGFVVYDVKSDVYEAGDRLEIAYGSGSVMYMLSDAAIARYAELQIVVSGVEVATAAVGEHAIIGRALDKAGGAGELIRVLIDLPAGFTAPAGP